MVYPRRKRQLGQAYKKYLLGTLLLIIIACIWWGYSTRFSGDSDVNSKSLTDSNAPSTPAKQPSAAELAEAAKEYQLGEDCISGLDSPADMIKAIGHFKKAAELGDANAQFRLAGILYQEADIQFYQGPGAGSERFIEDMDTEKINQAARWAQKAADQGDADAQALLGHMYFILFIAKQDAVFSAKHTDDLFTSTYSADETAQQALKWTQKAAEQNNSKGQVMMGAFCEGSLPPAVKKDDEKAVYWYTKAAEKGSTEAMEALRSLYSRRGDAEKEQYWREAEEKQTAAGQARHE
ncbi:sel1 repeat family protein [bacterium]|nr:sel1 repeat family protein [bacterium]